MHIVTAALLAAAAMVGTTVLARDELTPAEARVIAREANWLPAPQGPFVVSMRLYWPKPEGLDGRWKRPELQPIPLVK